MDLLEESDETLLASGFIITLGRLRTVSLEHERLRSRLDQI